MRHAAGRGGGGWLRGRDRRNAGGGIPFRCSAIESQDSLAQNSRLSLAATTVPHQTLIIIFCDMGSIPSDHLFSCPQHSGESFAFAISNNEAACVISNAN